MIALGKGRDNAFAREKRGVCDFVLYWFVGVCVAVLNTKKRTFNYICGGAFPVNQSELPFFCNQQIISIKIFDNFLGGQTN